MVYESQYYGTCELGDSLTHYGVLGMKWGKRKYQYEDGSLTPAGKKHYAETGEKGYQYKSWDTKHNEKKAAKALAKGDTKAAKKYEQRAKRSRELDKREQAYAESHSVAGNIAARALTGGVVGGKAYQQYLAMMGESKRKEFTKNSEHFAKNVSDKEYEHYLRQGIKTAKKDVPPSKRKQYAADLWKEYEEYKSDPNNKMGRDSTVGFTYARDAWLNDQKRKKKK